MQNVGDCVDMCNLNAECGHFTYNPPSFNCRSFKDTCTVSTAACKDCISGRKDCSTSDICLSPGLCLGSLVSAVQVEDIYACKQLCVDNADCGFFTFKADKICMLTKDCGATDPQCGGGSAE